jgi:hypothetical protein
LTLSFVLNQIKTIPTTAILKIDLFS